MPRIPYLPSDLNEPAAIVDAIRNRRGGDLYNLDRMLLHSPAFATGWNAFLGQVRNELEIPARLRELAICVVAVMNDAEYEYVHHLPEFAAAGATEDQMAALPRLANADADVSMFDATECAIIAATREMCATATVSNDTFSALREALASEQHVVEVVGVIAAYNMVSRFLLTLGIEPE